MNDKIKFVAIVVMLFLSACESGKEKKEMNLIEPNSEGAIIFKKFCSACHAPPRIASHKADEWLNIVGRMQHHRIMKAYNPLSESEKSTLVTYLQKHSAK